MLQVNLNKLRNISLRINHNHSGEYEDFNWKVIDWHENEEYCSKYDYKVQFNWKSNGRSMGTHMFYGLDANGKLLRTSVDWIIRHFIGRGKRPPRMHLMKPNIYGIPQP